MTYVQQENGIRELTRLNVVPIVSVNSASIVQGRNSDWRKLPTCIRNKNFIADQR